MGLLPLQEKLPFAIVGSERNIVINGKAVRGRRNAWGFVSSTRTGATEEEYANFYDGTHHATVTFAPGAHHPPVESDEHCDFNALRDFVIKYV